MLQLLRGQLENHELSDDNCYNLINIILKNVKLMEKYINN